MQTILEKIHDTLHKTYCYGFGYRPHGDNYVGAARIAGYRCSVFKINDLHVINLDDYDYDSNFGVPMFSPPTIFEIHYSHTVELSIMKGLDFNMLNIKKTDMKINTLQIGNNVFDVENTDFDFYENKDNETYKEIIEIEKQYPNLVIVLSEHVPKYKPYDGPQKSGIFRLLMVPVMEGHKNKVLFLDKEKNIIIFKKAYFDK